jgi:hypothetical protein
VNTKIIGQSDSVPEPTSPPETAPAKLPQTPETEEIGGRGGLETTRNGDWEKNGPSIDFSVDDFPQHRRIRPT